MESASEFRIIRRVLAREAARLSGNRPIPLDLEALVAEFRVGVVREQAERQGSLRRRGDLWQIAVDSSMAPVRQRFTIAHELGHYLVEATTGFRPTKRRDYWALESECQAFAAVLLAPEAVVRECLAVGGGEPGALFDVVIDLAARTGLSLEGAARRLIEVTGSPMAIASLRLDGRPSRRAIASIGWCHGVHGMEDVGRGRVIRRDHALWPVVTAIREVPVGACCEVNFGGGARAIVRREPHGALMLASTG
jgi:hypothetical protein